MDGCRELCYLQMKQLWPSHPKERLDLVKVQGVGLKGRCVKGQVVTLALLRQHDSWIHLRGELQALQKGGRGASETGGRKTAHSSLVLCVVEAWYQRPFPEKHKKPEMDWQKNVSDLGQGFLRGLKFTSRQWGNTRGPHSVWPTLETPQCTPV